MCNGTLPLHITFAHPSNDENGAVTLDLLDVIFAKELTLPGIA